MFVPAVGFFLSAAFFAVVGAITLRLGGARPVRLPVLAAFVLAAQAGVLAFGAVYGAVFADATNQLTSAGAVVGLLLGMPAAGTLCGWLAARTLRSRGRGRT